MTTMTGVSPHRGRDTTASPRAPATGTSPVKHGSAASPRQPLRPELAPEQPVLGPSGQQYPAHTGYTPYLQALEQNRNMDNMQLAPTLTQEDFHRAVHTLAAVSALHRQGGDKKLEGHKAEDEGGGHEAPSWTRGMSAAVLLGCTLLYAAIAGESNRAAPSQRRGEARAGGAGARGLDM